MRTFGFEVFALPKGIIVEKDVPIEARDGVKLAVNVYRPDAPGRFPVLIALTPYGKDQKTETYGLIMRSIFEHGASVGRIRVSENTPFEAPDPAFWVPRGYVVIHADVRGSGKSGGEKAWPFSKAEVEGYYDTIEWAGQQEWSNGNVGLNGVSYLAIAQYRAAAAQPPHLKAISPWEGWFDTYRDTKFPGGIPETNFQRIVLARTIYEGKTLDETALAAIFDPVANQKIIDDLPPLENITVPALICGAWSDQGLHTRGCFEVYRRIASKEKWLYTHGRLKWEVYYSEESLQIQKKFFDHFLKGIDNDMMSTPRVRLEVRETMDRYSVRYENEWPLSRTDYRPLYLNADGTMGRRRSGRVGKTTFQSVFGTALFDFTFDEEVELTGHTKLKLWVSTGNNDMDLIVGLVKINAKGEEVCFYGMDGFARDMVARGWLRLSQRELDEERSQPWQPVLKHRGEKKVKPGEIMACEIEILPSSTLFAKGDTLRLVIMGRDMIGHPRISYARLVNKGALSIYAGGDYDSHLLVPAIPAKPQ